MFIIHSLIVLVVLTSVNSNWEPFRAFLYSDLINCNHNKTSELYVEEIDVYFYDFKNNYNASFKIDDALKGLTSSYNLDVTRKLIFFVPGYKSNINKNTEEIIRQTFRDASDTYLIIIDHSAYTSAKGEGIESYERSVLYAYSLGNRLGSLLADIHGKGYPSKRIHCIGHSLGAQMLGYTGTAYINKTSEKIWRITGIDPAGPCFSNSFFDDQIRSGIAEYVEVYHCNAGGLGTTAVLADIDIFLNNGRMQPDCHESYGPANGVSEAAAECSHKACAKYWADTVRHPDWYIAWACDSYKAFSKGKCAANEVTIAGYSNPGNATGMFYVSTDAYETK